MLIVVASQSIVQMKYSKNSTGGKIYGGVVLAAWFTFPLFASWTISRADTCDERFDAMMAIGVWFVLSACGFLAACIYRLGSRLDR